MSFSKIKSYAKINLALNIVGKKSSLHKIESIVAFVDLHDDIFIKKLNPEDTKFHLLEDFLKIYLKKIQFLNY